MRKILITLALFFVCFRGVAQKAVTPKIYAMVIGVSSYIDLNVPQLKYADKDAKAFADYLKTPVAGAVPAENISLLLNENATRKNIMRDLVQLLQRAEREDLFIFYFSGHGKNDVLENTGYLMPYDGEDGNEAGSAIAMEEVKSRISKSVAKMKISFIDACHAGLFKTKGTKGVGNDNAEIAKAYLHGLQDADDGEAVILSSSSRQQSIESDVLKHGVFTYYLLKGLKGEADKEQKESTGFNNGIVSVSELGTYLTNKIGDETNFKQKPSIDGNYDDNFPLSVLRPNVLLTNEISRIKKRDLKSKDAQLKTDFLVTPKEEKLSDGMTLADKLCHGQYSFINMTSIPLTLFAIRSTKYQSLGSLGGKKDTDIKIARGEQAMTPRLYTYDEKYIYQVDGCNDHFEDYKFYFKGEKNGITVFVEVNATVEARKRRYFILRDDNINFLPVMPKMMN